MTELVVKLVIAYLLGCLVGSLVIGRIRGGTDIRTLGSGNAGATNALRTQGKAVAAAVLAIDVVKGWVATAWLAPATLPVIFPAEPALEVWAVPLCGLAVMLGHVYPLFFGFRGGKGVATLVGVVLGISGALCLVMLVTFLVAVILFGYVSLGSMLAAIAVAVAIALGDFPPRAPLLTFAVLASLLILYTHRSNIARLLSGSESRARRLWLLGLRRNT
ncbi:MAG TPA: glycerol-3-phosphate 1-O-acyltransferase PlsY [Steroidobacteraceae bacterium]|jgi:glycerol-3-phosphate acyltransferase PlsY|nr:glycerol-3-phosphate 1-O-acyltransferase PlsY [Steroidobacteraceae bacterium]